MTICTDHNCKGLTLIESLLYIALLSVLVPSAALIVDNLNRADAGHFDRAVVSNEVDFILHKLRWLLNGVVPDEVVAVGNRLMINSGEVFCLTQGEESNHSLVLYSTRTCDGAADTLTTRTTTVRELSFNKSVSSKGAFVVMTITLDEKDFMVRIPLP